MRGGRLLAGCPARLDLQRDHTPAGVQTAPPRNRGFPPPPAGSRVRTGFDRARAGRAADTRITFVVEGVIGKVPGPDVGPHIFLGPIEQRAHLPEGVALVPGDRLADSALL